MANPPGNQPSRDHRSSKPVELPMECAGPSTRSVPAVSLALLRMSIAASKGEPELSGEEDSAVLLRCGLHRCLHHRLGGMFDGLAVSVVWTYRARTAPHRQHCNRCEHQQKRWSTLPSHVATRPPPPPWSQKHLRLLRAIHIPGLLNRAADELSQAALPGEWRLHPLTVQLIERALIASFLTP